MDRTSNSGFAPFCWPLLYLNPKALLWSLPKILTDYYVNGFDDMTPCLTAVMTPTSTVTIKTLKNDDGYFDGDYDGRFLS